MRILSPPLTINTGAIISGAIDIGHHKIVGITITQGSTVAATDVVAIQQLVSGNLGQQNEVWQNIFVAKDDGTFTRLQILQTALAVQSYMFDEHVSGNLLPVLRLKVLVAASGADGTNVSGTSLIAKLILQPHP